MPMIADQERRLDSLQAWLDGELVVMTEEGRSSFGALQRSFAEKDNSRLAFYVFDLIYKDRDLSGEPLDARKLALADLIPGEAWNLQYVDYLRGEGGAFFEAACRQQLEGIVSKRADSRYAPGARSRAWLKSKSRSYPRDIAWEWWSKKDR